MLKYIIVFAGASLLTISLPAKAQEQRDIVALSSEEIMTPSDTVSRKETVIVDGVELNEKQLKRYYRQLRKDSIRAHKNVWWSVLGGPSYTPEASFGVGGAVLASFRMNKQDTISQRSFLPAGLNLSINGTIVVAGAGTFFFNENRFRIYMNYGYRNEPSHYYGKGFEKAETIERGDSTTRFHRSYFQLYPRFVWEIRPHFYLGGLFDLNYTKVSDVNPVMEKDPYFQQFKRGYPLELIVKDILSLYEKIRFQNSWKEGEKVKSYDFVKGRIIYRLVNRERNRKLLEDVPYKEYLDLAIVYYVLLEMDEYGMASMLVRREHLKMWKVSEEDIYYRACKNTQKLLPYDFSTMRSVIMELLEIGREIEEQTGKMYILSNVMRSYGACAMMYPDLLRKIGEELEENYYILPSSVHETIIVAESEAPGKEELCEMIEEINETQVEEEEVLSNRAYYYECDTGKLLF